MIIFDAIAPDGTRERLRFETQAEADTAADQHRAAGHSITWIAWSEKPSSASSPSRRSEQAMANLMPLVHHARRTIRNRQERNLFTSNEVLADLIETLSTAYLAAPNSRVSRTIKVELDLLETLI